MKKRKEQNNKTKREIIKKTLNYLRRTSPTVNNNLKQRKDKRKRRGHNEPGKLPDKARKKKNGKPNYGKHHHNNISIPFF